MKVEKTLGWLREEINKSTINEESKHINMHIRDAILMLAKENQPEPEKEGSKQVLKVLAGSYIDAGLNFKIIGERFQSLRQSEPEPKPQIEVGFCPVCNSKIVMEKPIKE